MFKSDIEKPKLKTLVDAYKSMGIDYPKTDDWLELVVLPGLRDGTRKFFTIHRESDGKVISLVLAKKTNDEDKICTVWTLPHYRDNGMATELIGKALQWLGNSFPILTIPEEHSESFRPIINKFNWELVGRIENYYRPGSTELIFNKLNI